MICQHYDNVSPEDGTGSNVWNVLYYQIYFKLWTATSISCYWQVYLLWL